MTTLILTALIILIVLLLARTADAHLVAHPHGTSLKAREKSQMTNLYHARYVCRHGARQHQRWACKARVWLSRELGETRAAMRRLTYSDPRSAILAVFGSRGYEALRVASCETGGTFSVYAQRGQYLGLFQMGSYARARYGHSWTALGQARAAHAYFVDAGSDWSPWQCKP